MLNNSHMYHQTIHDLKHRGIEVDDVHLNLGQMLKAKVQSVTSLTKGIEGLFKKNKVDYIKGSASFVSPTRIAVKLNDGGETEIETKNAIIATGSEVAPFPGGAITIDEKQIVSSTGALELSEVPKKMVVIGGGIIGLEMGSVWSRLGAEVTVVEFLGGIGGVGIDEEIAYATLLLIFSDHVLTSILAENPSKKSLQSRASSSSLILRSSLQTSRTTAPFSLKLNLRREERRRLLMQTLCLSLSAVGPIPKVSASIRLVWKSTTGGVSLLMTSTTPRSRESSASVTSHSALCLRTRPRKKVCTVIIPSSNIHPCHRHRCC